MDNSNEEINDAPDKKGNEMLDEDNFDEEEKSEFVDNIENADKIQVNGEVNLNIVPGFSETDEDNFDEVQKGEFEENGENADIIQVNGEDNLNIVPGFAETDEELLKRQLRKYHKNLIEAALYVSGRPLNIEELNTRLEIPKKEVEELINELAFDYLERSTALVINSVGEDYQMALKTEFIEKVSKFAKGGAIAEKYLRTLTVIALKQPILKSLLVKLRGTGAYEHVKYLIDNELISAVKKGRTQELTTTDKYAEMFGLPKNKVEMKRIMIAQLGVDYMPSKDDENNEENQENQENQE